MLLRVSVTSAVPCIIPRLYWDWLISVSSVWAGSLSFLIYVLAPLEPKGCAKLKSYRSSLPLTSTSCNEGNLISPTQFTNPGLP